MINKKGPGAGDAEARKVVISSNNLHLYESPDIFKIAIGHVTTADMDDGQPLPPFNEYGVAWCVVRRQHGRTLWRRITLQTKQPDAVTLDGGLSNQAASQPNGD